MDGWMGGRMEIPKSWDVFLLFVLYMIMVYGCVNLGDDGK